MLRFAAIFAVLVHHVLNFRQPGSWWAALLIRPGWTGVDLFFVLSGFLISGLLFTEFQKTGQIRFRRFAIRRALKLYPALYAVVVAVLLHRLVRPGDMGLQDIVTPFLHDVLFVQSYLPGTYGHFWSLSVEEHFYVLLPLTLYLLMRRVRGAVRDPFRPLPGIFLGVAAGCLGARLVHALMVQPYHYQTHLFYSHFRLDSLLFGVVLRYWWQFHPERVRGCLERFGGYLVPVSLVLILPAFVLEQSNPFNYTMGLTCFYLGYGGLLIAFVRRSLPRAGVSGFLLRECSYVGRHSYSIYLFHVPLTYQLRNHGYLRGWVGVPLYLAASIVAGIVLAKLIELPVLRLRDRFFPANESNRGIPRETVPEMAMAAGR